MTTEPCVSNIFCQCSRMLRVTHHNLTVMSPMPYPSQHIRNVIVESDEIMVVLLFDHVKCETSFLVASALNKTGVVAH